MNLTLVAMGGLVYGVIAGLLCAVVVATGLRVRPAYRFISILLLGALVLALIEGLGIVRESRLFSSWADSSLYYAFHRAAVGAAIGVGSFGLWRVFSDQADQAPQLAPLESRLLISNLLTSIGGSVVVSLLGYVSAVPLLPERGPLWGVPVLLLGCALVYSFGFVMGHVVWLLLVASRYPIEVILESLGEANGQGAWLRMSRAVLGMAAPRR